MQTISFIKLTYPIIQERQLLRHLLIAVDRPALIIILFVIFMQKFNEPESEVIIDSLTRSSAAREAARC